MVFPRFSQPPHPKTLEDLALALIIILVAASSFGLGRLSVTEKPREPLVIRGGKNNAALENLAAAGATTASSNAEGPVVASKAGAKYHYPWCPGAKTISEKNKITFHNAEEAEKAGYTKANNCK
jgi:hypothetical protein